MMIVIIYQCLCCEVPCRQDLLEALGIANFPAYFILLGIQRVNNEQEADYIQQMQSLGKCEKENSKS